ncbi:2839_t:CDS:2, partial [Acaulospora colombiana]
ALATTLKGHAPAGKAKILLSSYAHNVISTSYREYESELTPLDEGDLCSPVEGSENILEEAVVAFLEELMARKGERYWKRAGNRRCGEQKEHWQRGL